MRIKDILEGYSMQEDEAKTGQKIERCIQDISKCFEAVILSEVYFSVASASPWWMPSWKNSSEGAIDVYQSDRVLL